MFVGCIVVDNQMQRQGFISSVNCLQELQELVVPTATVLKINLNWHCFLFSLTYGLTNCGLTQREAGIVTQLIQLTHPIMRPAAGLQPNQTGRQVGKISQHLMAF